MHTCLIGPQFIGAADKFNIVGTDRTTLLNFGLNEGLSYFCIKLYTHFTE